MLIEQITQVKMVAKDVNAMHDEWHDITTNYHWNDYKVNDGMIDDDLLHPPHARIKLRSNVNGE